VDRSTFQRAAGTSSTNAPETREPVLAVEGLSFAYGDHDVLRSVDFALERGGFMGIVGPNGSGKSTLLRILDGLLKPRAGQVLLQGRSLEEYKRSSVAREIAFVPQEFALEHEFSVREVVEMGRYSRRKEAGGAAVVDEVLDTLGIDHLAVRPFARLSGGERQLVVLAQALVQQPSVLLLDEPASHLDVSHQLILFERLQELNRQGLTIACVLHDLNLALNYFDSLVMLKSGQVAAYGPAEEVLSPANVEAVYGVGAYMHRHAGRVFLTFTPRVRPVGRGRVHLVCGGGTGTFLMRELSESGFSVSVGVINALDTDEITGRELGLPMAVEAAFSPISDEAYAECLGLVDAADLVLVTEVPIGQGNARNLDVIRGALAAGKRVCVVEGLTERDFTGRSAALSLAGAELVKDSGEALALIGATL
jgi:iron complex transport system ATP-binding protein